MTNINLAQRTENRVANGMHQRVSVRMPIQSARVRDLHATENQLSTLSKRVDIVSRANVNHGRSLSSSAILTKYFVLVLVSPKYLVLFQLVVQNFVPI